MWKQRHNQNHLYLIVYCLHHINHNTCSNTTLEVTTVMAKLGTVGSWHVLVHSDDFLSCFYHYRAQLSLKNTVELLYKVKNIDFVFVHLSQIQKKSDQHCP